MRHNVWPANCDDPVRHAVRDDAVRDGPVRDGPVWDDAVRDDPMRDDAVRQSMSVVTCSSLRDHAQIYGLRWLYLAALHFTRDPGTLIIESANEGVEPHPLIWKI